VQVILFFTFQMFSQTPSLAKLILLTLCDTEAIVVIRTQRISPIDCLPNPLNLINACKYQMQFFGTHLDESQKCRKKKTETIPNMKLTYESSHWRKIYIFHPLKIYICKNHFCIFYSVRTKRSRINQMCKNNAEQTQMLAMVRLFKKTAAASRRPATKKKTELAIANAAPSAW
jgi:hypothetical protein